MDELHESKEQNMSICVDGRYPKLLPANLYGKGAESPAVKYIESMCLQAQEIELVDES